MFNELLFIVHVILVSFTTLLFATLGKEALVAYVSLLFVMANIFVIKQISLCSWYATTADAFIIGISLSLNLLQELWQKEIARKAIWISFTCSAFYMIMTQLFLAYVPVMQDTTQIHFEHVMGNTMRLVVASCVAYIVTQMMDTYVYAYMRQKTDGRYFVVRNYISICLSQFIDTLLFSFLGLYGILPNLIHIMVVSYVIKLCAIAGATPFLIYSKRYFNFKKD